jgi:hypothetical protein
MVLLSELKRVAKEKGIKGYSSMNKEQLEKALGIPPPSAYRAMRLSKLDLIKPSKETESKLKRWKEEEWLNLTAKMTDGEKLPCGKRGKRQDELKLPTVCRPSKKKSEATPTLASSFNEAQIKKAIELKKKGQRINWKTL